MTRDEEIGILVAQMREGDLDLGAPPAEARAGFDALVEAIPVEDSFTFSKGDLGGIPDLKVTGPGMRDSGAVLYLHGGGYVVGNAHGYRGLAARLGRAAGVVAHAIDYRLAPENPMPAAVDDAVAAYKALVASGVDPSKIVIAGDSAGGGLTLATLVALRDAGVPLPAAAFLISPWADLAGEGASMKSKAEEDPSLTETALHTCAGHYAGADTRNPVASPIHADLSGLPPLLIQVGSAEILYDDAIRVARAAGAAGTRVTLEVWPKMIHVWHVFAFLLSDGRDAIDGAGAFMRKAMEG
ncbi:alpha/beta hydrolase [Novosphingobium sp. ZN18A2]|uniref:alpha/beta hydrolase n=1 Tax=Novosphingobium sp. ZN18A2 TaxID=3079861 RepID=UPI0030CC81C3